MYSLRIPSWTDNDGKFHFGNIRTVDLVDILLAVFKPASDLVLEYYGEDAPKSAFKGTRYDRLVFFDKQKDSFIVMPNSPRNKGLWAKIS